MSFPGLIGKKRGMTQVFDKEGNAIPVTVVELLTLTVTQMRELELDGYSAVQVGYEDSKEKHLTKAQQGHLKKSDIALLRRLKEFRADAKDLVSFKVGDTIDPFSENGPLSEGILVNVTGKSIGKGTQGGTKRWGFSRGLMTHGSKSHRLPGSIGAGTTPGRVYKGTKMAGRMGNKQITQKHLKVVRLMPEQKVVLLCGSVPGVEGGYLIIKKSDKAS